MPADDYREGVQGKGSKWQQRVNTDESEQAYEGGATQEASEEYQQNASNSADEYASGLADYFGIDEGSVTVGSSYQQGVSDAGGNWRNGVQGAGSRWRDGVQETSAEAWEQAAADASEEWFNNAREGIQQG